MFKELDPLLHSQVRLAIMSILMGVQKAEFSYLLEHIETSKGNLSFQITKLKNAQYIKVIKSFRGNYPLTQCKITPIGIQAYETYVEAIKTYLK